MIRYIQAHEEYATTPLTISPNHHGWPHPILKRLLDGREVGKRTFAIHKNYRLKWFVDYDAWNKGSNYLIKKIKADKKLVKFAFKKSKEIADRLCLFIRYLEKEDIKQWTGRKIADFLTTTYCLANEASTYGYIPVFSDHLFHKFTHLLKEIIKRRTKNVLIDLSPPEILQILATPLDIIPSKLARIKLLKMLVNSKDDYPSESLKEKFKKHYHNWFWIDFGQLGPRVFWNQFIQSAEKLLKKRNQAEKEYVQLKIQAKKIEKEQDILAKKIKLDREEKYLFSVARDFMYLKGLRMEVLFGVYASWSKILDELSKRLKIKKKLLYYASIGELCDAILKRKSLKKGELFKRSKFCVWIALTPTRYKVFTGEAAKKFLSSLSYKEEKNLRDMMVIHGTVASLGYAKGHVKIVNKTSEINKVRTGDILVSVATHPGLLPAMKKAVAFITDAGGVTSHAAIVAREMKKPCIIGTKIATQVLKDGDLIELDTKKGDIFRIKQ